MFWSYLYTLCSCFVFCFFFHLSPICMLLWFVWYETELLSFPECIGDDLVHISSWLWVKIGNRYIATTIDAMRKNNRTAIRKQNKDANLDISVVSCLLFVNERTVRINFGQLRQIMIFKMTDLEYGYILGEDTQKHQYPFHIYVWFTG